MPLLDVFGDGTFMAGALLTVKPLRQPGKSPQDIGSRIIKTAAITGENEITIDLVNVEHSFVYLAGSPPTNHYVVWYGGGGAPFYPKDPKTINSYSEPNKTLGSPYGGAMPGDSASIGLTGFEAMRFVLKHGSGPFLGAEAINWGSLIITARDVEVGGYFVPNPTNTELAVPGTHGQITFPGTGDMVKEGATVYAAVPGIVRPAALLTHKFWLPPANRTYFSPANDGANLLIKYGVIGKTGDFTENYTVATSPVMTTGMTYAAWSGADATHVTYYDGGGAVTGYTPSNVDGMLKMQFNGNDAGKKISIRAEKAGTVASPGNGVPLASSNYESYGKKMDRVVLFDESGILAAHVGSLVGLSINFHWCDAVFYGKAAPEWTEYGKDEWAAIGAGDYVSEHGRGRVYIRNSWFAGKPEGICFRL